uniref:Uncharacterized protein n=1 Tax=Sphaerodactylus townsendi TaxID=933632 RepID=A0ACB8FZK1_9SAUR
MPLTIMWVTLVSLVGVLSSGCMCQLVLTQPPSMAQSPGSTVMISCAMSSGYSISTERVYWFQQKLGGPPLYLYHYHKSSDQARISGIPERFSVSPNRSNNLWNLVIAGVQADDDADYYCYAWDDKLKTCHSVASAGGTETKSFRWLHTQGQVSAEETVKRYRMGREIFVAIVPVISAAQSEYCAVPGLNALKVLGAFAQFVLTQSPSTYAPLGGTVKIPCPRSSGSIATGYISWYQQKPDSALKLIMYEFLKRPTGIPDRFSGSMDTSANSGTLTISNVQAEDEANYHCLSHKEWATHSVFVTQFSIVDGPSSQQLQSLGSSGTVSLSGTTTLSCRQSSGTITDTNYPFWLQQKQGTAPRLIIHSTSSRPSGGPDRFSGSRSGDTMSLTLTGALMEDEADYYCATWTGSGWHSHECR